MQIAQIIVGNRAHIVTECNGVYSYKTQPINAKTGKPWQASRDDKVFYGEKAKAQAMRHWLYASTAAKKSAKQHRPGASAPTHPDVAND